MSEPKDLPSHASVVVIGGGSLGCSTLYHLAKFGVKDAILLERHQLTSGTTWHSAAQVRQLRSTRNLTRLIQYSAKLYSELEAETGQQTGWVKTGSLSIANNADRMIHIRRQSALAEAYGVTAEEISIAEAGAMWPLLNTDDLVGAVFSPDDGRVNPSDFCAALAKGARNYGAQIFENTTVTGFLKDGSGRIVGVETNKGPVRCEQVALCGGLWSRDLGNLAGVDVPLLPCEHFYLLTKPIDGITGHLPTLSDHDSHLYIRDDVGGLLVGCFEPEGKPLTPQDLGENFAFGLLPEDWDHFEPMMINALHRIPALETAEVRTLLNGPESFTPDSSFLLGETAEVPGLFLGCGMNSVGVATGGGAGWALAQWMIEGAAPFHLGEADPNRFHAVENRLEALMERAPEVLGKHYEIHYPGRQLQSARNLRLGPLYETWKEEKAHFGQVFGWERPLYFNSDGPPALTYDRPAWFEQVGREVQAAHESAAVFDQSTFGKIDVVGPDAETFLNRLCANNMARPVGRAIYTAMLNAKGGYESDFTALRLSETHYRLYIGSGAIRRDMSRLKRNLLEGEEVNITDVTVDFAILGLMGPKARELALDLCASEEDRQRLADLGYFSHDEFTLGGVTARATRLSYVGEAGWEFTCAAEDAAALYQAFKGKGAKPAGGHAQTSMRIEKRFLSMGHDLDGEVNPFEAGLEFAVKKTGGFIGAEALEAERSGTPEQRMVTIVLDDEGALPLGDEPVYGAQGEGVIGQVTSAAFGYRVGRPVALAYIKTAAMPDGEERAVSLDIAGTRFGGRAGLSPAFDPSGSRMR